MASEPVEIMQRNGSLKEDEMDETCSTHGLLEKSIQNFGWKTPLGRARHRWESNIIMDLKERGWECMDWIHLSQDTD
jgi:hypothetical protein